tara:strand:- start:889 stop:2787 length:1899 start_codon:yes stop_codon:yes gene_type:complete
MAQNDETIRKVTYELHVQKSAQAESDVKQFADEVKASEEEITKTVKAEADKRNKAQKESLDKAAEDYAAYSEDVNSKNREFNDSLMGVAEGALKVGEGFVLMGLAAEEDLVKVVQTLAAVKGSVDAIRGGVEIYRNITAGVEAYNKAVLAAASAEGLLAAARLRSAGAGAASAAVGIGAAGAASGIGAAAETIGGVGGGAASSAIGGVAAAKITAAGAGAGAGTATASTIGSGFAAVAGVLASLPAAIAAAFVGVLGAGAMATNIGGSRDKAAGMFGDINANSWIGSGLGTADFLHSLGGNTNAMNPVGLTGDFLEGQGSMSLSQIQRNQQASEATTGRLQNRMTATRERDFRVDSQEADRFAMEQQLDLLKRNSSNPMGDRDLDFVQGELALAQGASQASSGALAGMGGMNTDRAAFGNAETKAIQDMDRVVALRKEAFGLAQQTAQAEITGANEALKGLSSQLDLQQKITDQAEGRLMTAKERFGQLSEVDQRKLISAKQKADKQGFGALNRTERGLLSSVGTDESSELAKQGNLAAAQRAGFDRNFGGGEQQIIRDSATQTAKLQADVKVQNELIVKVEDDTTKLEETIVAEVIRITAERDELMIQRIERRMEQNARKRNGGYAFTPLN